MVRELYVSYEAPQVEVIEVEVEKGFAQSLGQGNAPFFGPGEDFATQVNEIFEQIWE